jgi:hypothetical protein
MNQSLGLADALQRLLPELSVTEIPALSPVQALSRILWPWRSREGFDLLIGAGHGTHLTLLALARVERCPVIVLMRPSLPRGLFDLIIEPRHDGGRESEHCWLSDGPLNRMQPAAGHRDNGLMLIGGPSPHYRWDSQAILEQIAQLCDGGRRWVLSSSRRTPADFMPSLAGLALPGLDLHRAEELPSGWLAEQLPGTAECWVTPDSASMVYEALTAGCRVGLFDLPALDGSRVAGGIAHLAEQGRVTRYADHVRGVALAPPADTFAEADRCAGRILERGWL